METPSRTNKISRHIIKGFISSCQEDTNYDFIYTAILHIFDFAEFMQELHNYMQETSNTPSFVPNLFNSLLVKARQDKKEIRPFMIEHNKVYMEGVEHKDSGCVFFPY